MIMYQEREHTMALPLLNLGVMDTLTIWVLLPSLGVVVLWLGWNILKTTDIIRRLYIYYATGPQPQPLTRAQGRYIGEVLIKGIVYLLVVGAGCCVTVVIDQARFFVLRWASQEFGVLDYQKVVPIAAFLADDFSAFVDKFLMTVAFVVAVVVSSVWNAALLRCLDDAFMATKGGDTDALSSESDGEDSR